MKAKVQSQTRGLATAHAAGTFSLQLLVVLVPVFFGLMGFAVDLGRLYLIKGELNQAASAMALASAGQLIGNSTATDNATSIANSLLDDTTGHAARYNFGANIIGQTTGLLNSTVNPPAFYATMTDATSAGTSSLSGGNQADTTTARDVQVTLSADAPLLFWSFLSLGQQRSTPVGAVAVAGISSPVCVACNVEPFAVAAVDSTDPQDFGFVYGSYYTFYYQCTATGTNPQPQPLTGTGIPYILIDHYDSGNAADDETQQLYLAGANGLLSAPTSDQTAGGLPMSCITIGSAEAIWGSTSGGTPANPNTCGSVPQVVQDFLCGLYTRMDTAQAAPSGCESSVTDADNLAASFLADIDVNDPGGDYTAYAGNGRRIITVPVVDAFGTLDVLGFRQFLVIANPDGTGNLNPIDATGRFVVMYMGMSPADNLTTPAPVRQGSISGCQNGYLAGQGPGKVVLHQ